MMRKVFYNGIVYTGDQTLSHAFVVEGDKFIFVGENDEALSFDADEKIDLSGAFVCAGFNDSHMHLLNFGQSLMNAPLAKHTGSLSDMIDCLKNAKPGRGGWIIGRGWNQDYFADTDKMPTRWDLDKASTEHPICATRACGHALCVNSKALELLGLTNEIKSPEGGSIGMENGELNGLFFDNAMELIYSKMPAPKKEDVKDMLLLAAKELNSYGITSCQSDDYCVFKGLSWETVNEAYEELIKEGRLTVRVYEQANFSDLDELRDFIQKGNVTGKGDHNFKIGPLKMLGDGALGARTALLSRPYADENTTSGLGVFTQEEFDALIGLANKNQMQAAVHAIGDKCLDMVISSYEKALGEHPREDHRHGIVHCQITRPDQLEKMIKMKLNIYAQSIFLDYDIHIVNQRAGKELAGTSYSWKTLMDGGLNVSNGSDCPVELPNVLGGIYCAVTRRDLKGCEPYLEDQAFTVKESIDSFTKNSAVSSFEEDIKGRIKEGFLADFTVLDKDLFSIDPSEISNVKVIGTYLGGKKVY